ncbi:PspC domain-containing protein [Marinilabiliaceae bacterium JC017]|nr:PspC domain-containing protein [Marinilabiliaceae bacterium JC017]
MIKYNPSNNKIVRPRKRYFGGVCEALGSRYNFAPIWFRLIFLLATLLLTFPPLIYIFLWFSFPNYQECSNKKERNIYQLNGLILGAIIGAAIGFFGPILIFGMISGLILLFLGFIGLPIGALTGFMIGKGIVERK